MDIGFTPDKQHVLYSIPLSNSDNFFILGRPGSFLPDPSAALS